MKPIHFVVSQQITQHDPNSDKLNYMVNIYTQRAVGNGKNPNEGLFANEGQMGALSLTNLSKEVYESLQPGTKLVLSVDEPVERVK